MTPGWQNVRIGLAVSHQTRPRWDAWRRPGFWLNVAASGVLWVLIYLAVRAVFG